MPMYNLYIAYYLLDTVINDDLLDTIYYYSLFIQEK